MNKDIFRKSDSKKILFNYLFNIRYQYMVLSHDMMVWYLKDSPLLSWLAASYLLYVTKADSCAVQIS